MADETDTTTTATETAEATVDAVVVDPSVEGTVLGGDEVEAPAEEAPDAAEEPRPEGPPEAYDLTAPEGFTLDPASIELATPVFKEIGLTNEQANKLMPVAAEFAKRQAEQGQQAVMAEVVAQRKAWAQEAQSDEEIGGGKWEETQHLAAKGLDALGYPKGSPFRNLLNDSGLGNHPEMIRAFRRIGEMVGEDGDFVRGDVGAQIKQSREEVLYPNDVRKEGA